MSVTPLKTLRSQLGKAPALAFALSHEDLLAVLRSPGPDLRVRDGSVAEAFHRLWLYRRYGADGEVLRRRLLELADLGIQRAQLEDYFDWLQYMNVGTRRCDLPRRFLGHGAWDLLRVLLAAWQASHGAVVFVCRHPKLSGGPTALVTPFVFEPGSELVVDCQRRPWSAFEAVVRKALTRPLSAETLVFPLLDQEDVGGLFAGSAGLAVAFAAAYPARQQFGNEPLSFLVTGACEAGKLQAVSGVALKAELAERLGAKLCFYPEGCMENPQGRLETSFLPLPLQGVSQVFERMLIELGRHGIGPRLTREVVDKALTQAEWDLKLGRQPAARVLRTLESLEAVLEKQARVRSSVSLSLKIHKASALCHMGESEQAQALLEECYTSARLQRQYPLLCTAVAQHVVALNDLCRFKEAEAIAEEHIQRLEEEDLDEDEVLDARMRLYGSLGQTYLSWSLSGQDHRVESRACLEKALASAEALTPGVDTEDVFKDLNYLALWRACFEPEGAQEYIEGVIRRIELAKDYPEVSHQYLLRIQLFACYRRYLESGVLPNEFPRRPVGKPSWLKALASKYLGTLLAAQGRTEEAVREFNHGKGLFEQEGAPLLRFFGFTLCVQAMESLRGLEEQHVRFREAARRFYEHSVPYLPKALIFEWECWDECEYWDLPWLSMIY